MKPIGAVRYPALTSIPRSKPRAEMPAGTSWAKAPTNTSPARALAAVITIRAAPPAGMQQRTNKAARIGSPSAEGGWRPGRSERPIEQIVNYCFDLIEVRGAARRSHLALLSPLTTQTRAKRAGKLESTNLANG